METDRILLRPWRESDAEVLYKYASDPEVGPRAGWPPHKSVEESLEIIRTVFGNDHTWAIELKETGEAIGCIGYFTCGESNINIGENDVEAGYWVARPYWNRGICTEALHLLIDHCFGKKRYSSIWSDFFVDNPASGRVMEKCDFRDTGTINYCSRLQLGSDRPVKVMKLESPYSVRPFQKGDEAELADMVAYTLRVSNREDYSPEYLEDIARSHSPEFFVENEGSSHFYVVRDGERIIGCGGITAYQGSVTESYLLSVFVHPDYQGRGLGKMIMETLESDEYFQRAHRAELASSITAVGFYQRMGYAFKNGISAPDELGVISMEKTY